MHLAQSNIGRSVLGGPDAPRCGGDYIPQATALGITGDGLKVRLSYLCAHLRAARNL